MKKKGPQPRLNRSTRTCLETENDSEWYQMEKENKKKHINKKKKDEGYRRRKEIHKMNCEWNSQVGASGKPTELTRGKVKGIASS